MQGGEEHSTTSTQPGNGSGKCIATGSCRSDSFITTRELVSLLFFTPLLQGQWTHSQGLTRNSLLEITFLDWWWSVWARQWWWLRPGAAVLWMESFFQTLSILAAQPGDSLAAAHRGDGWKAGMRLTWLLEGNQVFSVACHATALSTHTKVNFSRSKFKENKHIYQ